MNRIKILMSYMKNTIGWKVFKASLGTSIAAALWRSFYREQLPAILFVSIFLISFSLYLLEALWEEKKISTVLAFIISNNGKWEFCRVPYKGKKVFGALLRNGISVVELAICIKPDRMGFVEKHEFMAMNGGIINTKDGSFVLSASEKEIILCEIEKAT